jgi:tetratricopeptide (TPR) repeat protein
MLKEDRGCHDFVPAAQQVGKSLVLLAALCAGLIFGAITGRADVVQNVFSLFVFRALVDPGAQIGTSPLVIGRLTIQNQPAMREAMSVGGNEILNSRKGVYLHALALYALGHHVVAATELQREPVEALNPVEKLLLGNAWYAMDSQPEAGGIWRQIGVDLPMLFLARRDLRIGNYDDALPLYLRLQAISPQDSEIQVALGDIYRNRANPDYEAAVAAYQRAAKLGQDPDQIRLLIIVTELAATRNSVIARAQLEMLLAGSDLAIENRITALRVMHNIYRYNYRDFASAEQYLLAAVALPRKEGDIWEERQLALGYLEMGNCDAARRWLAAAVVRYRDTLSPEAQLEQLRSEVAEVCSTR